MRYDLLLKSGKYKIGVWGTGYIGFSTMAFFARAGISSIGCDVSREKVDLINKGEYIMKELKSWLSFPIKPLVKKGLIKATSDHNDLAKENVLVHFVAVPTERNGKPYFKILKDVIKKICILVKMKEPSCKVLVIIESTLSPRTSDKLVMPLFKRYGLRVGEDILFGVAPRRDWFVEGGKNLKDLDRVFGGYDEASSEAMEDVLGIVCRKLHRASNCYISEMVKSFENAYRHMEITLANQISLAYPSQDIREALELVGTKWNIGTFRPGFGTGGYCIPVASKYVIDGAESPRELSILKETIKTDNKINVLIAKSIIRRKVKRIGVLGLSYKGNLKVSLLSPTIPFVETLVRAKREVKIFDPYFSDEEIKRMLNISTFKFPEGLNEFDALVLVVDHKEYDLPKQKLLDNIRNCKIILDNTGLWSEYKDCFKGKGVDYYLAGDANWL